MSQHPTNHNVIAQIKVTLLGASKPPVWRRLQLRADTRLDRLHGLIQAAFGWEDYHLHSFTRGQEEFGPADPDLDLDFNNERDITLGELIGGIGDRLRYTYDFGDNWEHEILVEQLHDPDPETRYPALIAAKGACPPEDCGGVWGYANLKEALADPSHEEHQEMLEWLGLDNANEFDPTTVTTDNLQKELALTSIIR
jgi:hypothetical protein